MQYKSVFAVLYVYVVLDSEIVKFYKNVIIYLIYIYIYIIDIQIYVYKSIYIYIYTHVYLQEINMNEI